MSEYTVTYLVRNTRVEEVVTADEVVVGCCARWRRYRLCDHVNRMPCTESAARCLAYKTVSLYCSFISAAAAASDDNALSVLRPRRSSSSIFASSSYIYLHFRPARPLPLPPLSRWNMLFLLYISTISNTLQSFSIPLLYCTQNGPTRFITVMATSKSV